MVQPGPGNTLKHTEEERREGDSAEKIEIHHEKLMIICEDPFTSDEEFYSAFE